MVSAAVPSPELSREGGREELEHQLMLRYHNEGDVGARQELAERFLPLARNLAQRYTYTDEPFDDLLQVASLGLIKAIDRFDPSRGNRFTSYATPTILGELKRHFRDKGWAMHVPRDLQERAMSVTRETEQLSKRLGRSPRLREVADALGFSVEVVVEAQEAAASYASASLDAPTASDDDSASLIDLLGHHDSAYELVAERDAIAGAWRRLPQEERRVVELRFMHDLTQREIGDKMGHSQMQISRLLRRALGRLETATSPAS
jgi:RNA polymerase sigma-B factor